MSNEAVLKEFLVSLGFKIDKSSERKFADSVAAATVKVVQLGAAVTATATAVVAGVAKIADNLEQLYFATQRTKASAENIRAYQFAVKQLGGDGEAALGSLENLARFMRQSPGAEGLLKNIGVQTRDASGQLRDSVDMMGELGAKFAAMPFYKANAYAQALGIDEKTLMAMRQGVGQFSAEYKAMLRAVGLDLKTATAGSHDFMNEVRLLGTSVTIMSQKVASDLQGRIGDQVRRLREAFVANAGRITQIVGNVLELVMRAADALGILALRGGRAIGRVIDWFNGLSDGSQKIIKWFGAILVAWRVLSLGFMATPLGRVVALALAVASLWDDYQVWKEGGKSLIDWSAWAPGIEAAIAGIKQVGEWIHKGLEFTGDWRPAFELLLAYVAGKWMFGMLGAIGKVATAAGGVATGLLGKAGLVGAAGLAGYGVGTWINDKFIDGTKAGDMIGGGIASLLGMLGVKEAQEAVEARDKAAKAGVMPLPGQDAPPTKAPVPATTPGAAKGGKTGAPALFDNLEKKYNLPRGLLDSVWSKESDRGHNLTSPKGAQGHFQFMPPTAKAYGLKNPNDLTESADAAARMYADLLKWSKGNLPKALAGYNWGAGNVEKFGMDKMPAETRDYIGKITSTMPAQAAKPVEVNQTTTITVQGGGDAKQVAREVATAQNGVNERLTRNMRGAVLQ